MSFEVPTTTGTLYTSAEFWADLNTAELQDLANSPCVATSAIARYELARRAAAEGR